MAADPHIVDDAELMKQGGALKRPDQAALSQPAGLQPGNVLTLIQDPAARWPVIAADEAERRGFTGPVGADQSVNAVALYGKGQVVDGCEPSELPYDIAQFENRFVGQWTLPLVTVVKCMPAWVFPFAGMPRFYSAAAGVASVPR